MPRYHLKADGNPARCTASVKNCPLGADALHGDSPEALYKAFEEKMKSNLFPEKATARETPAKKIPAAAPKDLVTDPYKGNTITMGYEYWDWDGDRECARERRGQRCTESYCHDQQYGDFVINEPKLKEKLEAMLGVKSLPEEVANAVDFRNVEQNFVAVVSNGYYGEEADVRLKKSVQEAIDKFHYSRPNVASTSGALEFARVNGLDTSGKDEMQALKSMTSEKLPKEAKALVEKSNIHSKQSVPLSKIKFVAAKASKAEPANIPLNNQLSNNAAGVLVPNGDNTYTLVSDDYSRFAAVQKAGRKQWNFYILGHREERHSFGQRKEPLSSRPTDVSDW